MHELEPPNNPNDETNWFQYANCKGKTEIMFPEYYSDRSVVSLAKRICSSCVVKKDCLEYALENKEVFGIYGGTTPRERSRMESLVKKNDGYYLTN